MKNWFNPRVFAVGLSIVVLAQISKVDEPHRAIRRGCLACGVMLLLYIAAFIFPLLRLFGIRRIMAPLSSLTAGWCAVALALVADALPVSLEEQLARHVNVPMMIACVAAAAAFYLFFDNTNRAFRLREQILEARRGR